MIMSNHYGADAKGFKFYCIYQSSFLWLSLMHA